MLKRKDGRRSRINRLRFRRVRTSVRRYLKSDRIDWLLWLAMLRAWTPSCC